MRTPIVINVEDLQSASPALVPAIAAVAVLIPAWQPGFCLVPLVSDLLVAGFGAIVIVDDGSAPEFSDLFYTVAQRPGVHLLRHAVNLGKGRALKTGLNHILATIPDCSTIVTADADGQHTSADVLRVALVALEPDAEFVLGVRTFSRFVPLRSYVGNTLSRRLFSFLTGVHLADTQTGLRAYCRALLPQLLSLEGERYEYEMTVLAHLCRSAVLPLQVPVETLYIDGNRSSHFNPIRDSLRIYFALIQLVFYRSVNRSVTSDYDS